MSRARLQALLLAVGALLAGGSSLMAPAGLAARVHLAGVAGVSARYVGGVLARHGSQVACSTGVGLLAGGAQRTAAAIRIPLAAKPSPAWMLVG